MEETQEKWSRKIREPENVQFLKTLETSVKIGDQKTLGSQLHIALLSPEVLSSALGAEGGHRYNDTTYVTEEIR